MVPVPWSVPAVPLTAAVRPNSVTTRIAVSFHAGPSVCWNAAKELSNPVNRVCSRCASAACVSQPSKARAQTRGPSGAASNRAAPCAIATMVLGSPAPPEAFIVL